MTAVRQIINSALRKLGRLGSGRDARQQDAKDALDALQSLYTGWVASGTFGRLYDVVPGGSSFTASGNQRIVRTASADFEVILPELVSRERVRDYGHERMCYATVVLMRQDGQTVSITTTPAQPIGWVETPSDGSPVVITDQSTGITASWLYDGTAKKWQRIDDLQLDDEAPRSEADRDGLAACLALQIADQYGVELQPSTIRAAQRYTMQMTHRYGMRREDTQGSYF